MKTKQMSARDARLTGGQFAVFAGSNYYPQGGFRDYRGSFETLAGAKEKAEVLALNTHHISGFEWVHVADLELNLLYDLQEGNWVEIPSENRQ